MSLIIIGCGGCNNRSTSNEIIDVDVCDDCKKQAIESHNQTWE